MIIFANYAGGWLSYLSMWDSVLSDAQVAKMGKIPWASMKRQANPAYAAAATIQVIRPASDISAGSWAPSSGSDLFAMLDEVAYDDADYIYSNVSGISDAVFGIAPTMAAGDHTLNFRAFTNTGTCQQRVRLQDSGGSSVGVTGYSTVTATPQTFSLPITLTGTAARAVIETIP